MSKKIFVLIIFIFSMSTWANTSLVKAVSANSVKGTMDKLEMKLKEKGMNIFSRISHSDGATSVGLNLRDTELLIFGNPKIGSKLMACNQEVGIDLPLKILAWRDEKGQVWLAYNDVAFFERKYDIKECAKKELLIMKTALNNFVQFSIK